MEQTSEQNNYTSNTEKNQADLEFKNFWEEELFQVLDRSIILHLPTTEFLIKKRDWEALILFLFYCYCSKLQRNSKRVWVANSFTQKNLKWRKQRVLQARKRLVNYGIIKAIPYKEKSEKNNKIVIKKWFIEIIPLLNAQNILNNFPEVPVSRGSQNEPVENGNHSSIQITYNKFNTNKYKYIEKNQNQSFYQEESVEEIYPRLDKVVKSQILKCSRCKRKIVGKPIIRGGKTLCKMCDLQDKELSKSKIKQEKKIKSVAVETIKKIMESKKDIGKLPLTHQERTKIQEEVALEERKAKTKKS